MAIEVQDRHLSFIRVDQQVRLQFGDCEFVLEAPFVLAVESRLHRLDPAERSRLGPLLGLYPDALSLAGVEADGTLQLVFDSGAVIRVAPSPEYEAWQVIGAVDHHLVVCMPGGQLAFWH